MTKSTYISLVVGAVLLALAGAVCAQAPNATDIQCIHYRNDYRRPWYCDPRPIAEQEIIIVAPLVTQPPQRPQPRALRELHRQGNINGGHHAITR